ncbi:diguanylate cyclase [Deltaproteobacteria bacterium OttesenSCG-928-K17]|nr:diguanylate cyclase [Deltaproteobacteria bacterium OttesenSCG-928-K17]
MAELIKTDENICIGCNRCTRVCPVETANNTVLDAAGNIKVFVNQDHCIACGACVKACHHGARYFVDDTDRFFLDLAAGEPINLMTAPSLRTNFPEWKRLLTLLRRMGVRKIYDVSLGGDLCVWGHLRYMEKHPDLKVITQPCPAVVSYCERFRTELIDYLSPIHSPVGCTQVLMRKYDKVEGKIAGLTPCFAKRHEFSEIGVEYSLVFERLARYLDKHGIKLPDEESGFDHSPAGLGSLMPMPGGLKENLDFFYGPGLGVWRAEGDIAFHQLNEYLNSPKALRPRAFDLLSCTEGCNLGPGSADGRSYFAVNRAMEDLRAQATARSRQDYLDLLSEHDRLYDLNDFIRSYTHRPPNVPVVTEKDIQLAFAKLEKYTPEKQQVDCGACGSGTCRDMARKIALGVNIPINCIMKSRSDMNYIARHDALTGLYNRRGFSEYMAASWPNHSERVELASAILIDIDYFKRYNDNYGHLAGDDCLRKVTGAISQALESEDYMLARYGGEEFIAIAYGIEHDKMLSLAIAMRERVQELGLPHPDNEASNFVTVSIGLATQRTDQLPSYEELIAWADECLYFAKRTGRNRVIHTCDVRGRFTDIRGICLSAGGSPPEQQPPIFDEEDTERILKDIGVNCTFAYNARLGEISFSNPAMDLFGLPAGVKAKTAGDIAKAMSIAVADRPQFRKAYNDNVKKRKSSFAIEVQLTNQKQRSVPVSVTGQFRYGQDGAVELYFGSLVSLSHMAEYNQFLRNQTMINGITQLPNREKFKADLFAAIEDESVNGYFVVLDIRGFNEINGHYGRLFGDKLLHMVARQLSKMPDSQHLVYNHTVDQFLYIMKGADKEEADKLMRRIHRFFSTAPMRIDSVSLQVAFSIVGIPYSTDDGMDQLLQDIDHALHMAKLHQEEPFLFFDLAAKQESYAMFELRYELKKAVEGGMSGFTLHYQPILDGRTKRIMGAEALLRWQNSAGETLLPGRFIPILEDAGLMGQVDNWVLKQAARQGREWIDLSGDAMLFINVNLSPGGVGNLPLQEIVSNALRDNGLAPHNITLEITETTSITKQHISCAMKELREKGMNVAIDDFGTGFSSLSYLKSLPASEVKIDRSFLHNIDTDESQRLFVLSIINMLKSMNFAVCVEGVETHWQDAQMTDASVDMLQGFYYGKPGPPEQFLDLIQARQPLTAG